MKIARLILTFREDLIPTLRDFYLGGNRTDFLVIAYNSSLVNADKFKTNDKFKLVPYTAPERNKLSISGLQYKVWVEVAKKFPEVEGWVIHDYDFCCKPKDSDLFSHIKEDEYGMIGRAFPVWKEGMGETAIDTYPFPQSHRYWHVTDNPTDQEVDALLMQTYPAVYGGVTTVMGGYSDFIVTTARNLLFLDDPVFSNLPGGLEQIPHSVWHKRNVKSVDFRKFYKMKVLMDVLYVPFSEEYDMLNPVKFWPGHSPDLGSSYKNIQSKFKKVVKQVLGYQGWRK